MAKGKRSYSPLDHDQKSSTKNFSKKKENFLEEPPLNHEEKEKMSARFFFFSRKTLGPLPYEIQKMIISKSQNTEIKKIITIQEFL